MKNKWIEMKVTMSGSNALSSSLALTSCGGR